VAIIIGAFHAPSRDSVRAPPLFREFSDPDPCGETSDVEIELKRSAKSVIERIVNLRDSL